MSDLVATIQTEMLAELIDITKLFQDEICILTTFDLLFEDKNDYLKAYSLDIMPAKNGEYLFRIDKLMPIERAYKPTNELVLKYVLAKSAKKYHMHLQAAVSRYVLDCCEDNSIEVKTGAIVHIQDKLDKLRRKLDSGDY